jgi:DNA repair protein RecO
MRQREEAICLGVADYSETSQVVHFLTRGAGVARLIAKGSKRPKSHSGGAIDLLSEGQIVYIPGRGESLGTLVEFSESVARGDLRKDAGGLEAALFMIEAAGRLLAPGDPYPEAFDLLHNSLQRLAQREAPKGAVLAYFLWRLLRHAGLLGELRACVSCGAALREAGGPLPAGELHFSSAMGGLLCASCEGAAAEKYRLDGPTKAALAALPAAEAGKRVSLPSPQARGVVRLLAYHIAHQTGRPLRMARHYKAEN